MDFQILLLFYLLLTNIKAKIVHIRIFFLPNIGKSANVITSLSPTISSTFEFYYVFCLGDFKKRSFSTIRVSPYETDPFR